MSGRDELFCDLKIGVTVLLNEDQEFPELIPDFIWSLLAEDSGAAVPHLEHLLTKRSPEVRLAAVGSLGRIPSGVEVLRKHLELERNELVLSEICEVLGYAHDQLSLPKMKVLARDHKSSLVRAYASLAVADIAGNQELPFLRELLRSAKSSRLKASLSFALIVAGDWAGLDSLLRALSSKDPIVRVRVTHFLADETCMNRGAMILPALEKAFEREKLTDVAKVMREAIASFSNEHVE